MHFYLTIYLNLSAYVSLLNYLELYLDYFLHMSLFASNLVQYSFAGLTAKKKLDINIL